MVLQWMHHQRSVGDESEIEKGVGIGEMSYFSVLIRVPTRKII